MSNPTTPDHDYVRPGQVAPGPVPDHCMTCGLSEAEHRAATTPASGYARAAADADARVDAELADLRRRSDNGLIGVTEAAEERISLMTTHLERISALRQIYFGVDDPGGWMSGSCSSE